MKTIGKIIIALILVAVVSKLFFGGKKEKQVEKEVVYVQVEATPTPEVTQEPEETAEPETKQEERTGVSPEFEEMMDSYEEFFDEYIELMQSVEKDPAVITSSKYLQFMTQYYDTSAKFEALEDEEMTDEEELYYLEVQSRINQKLYQATGY